MQTRRRPKRLSYILKAALISFLGLSSPAFSSGQLEENKQALSQFAQQLKDNARYSATWHSTYFPTRVNGKVALQNDLIMTAGSVAELNENIMFGGDVFAALTDEEGIQQGLFTNPRNTRQRVPFADFKQLYVLYRLGNYDFSVGKMTTDNSLAELGSITNLFNEAYPLGYQGGVVTGVWHARIDYYNSLDDQLSLMIRPFDVRDSVLPTSTRWYGDVGGHPDLLFQLSSEVEGLNFRNTGFHDSQPQNWSWYAKYSGSRDMLDFFGGLYYGHSPYSTVHIFSTDNNGDVNIVDIRRPRAFDFMGGVSTIRGNKRFYGEGLFQYTIRGHDDNFLQLLAGVNVNDTYIAQKLKLEKFSYTIEISHDEAIRIFSASDVHLSSRNARKNVNSITTQINAKKDQHYSAYFGSNFNYFDSGLSYFVGVKYNHSDNLYANLSFNGYGGRDGSAFAGWKDNKSLQFSAGYYF